MLKKWGRALLAAAVLVTAVPGVMWAAQAAANACGCPCPWCCR